MSVVRVLQLVIFLIPIFTLAQTRVASHPLEVSKNRENDLKVLPLVNEKNQTTCFLFKERNELKARLLNANFEVQSELLLKHNLAASLFDYPVGHFYKDSVFVLVGKADPKQTHFSFLEINFAKGAIILHERWKLSFSEAEALLGFFSEQGKFYALSVFKNNAALRLYTFDKPMGVPKIEVFDLPNSDAVSKEYKNVHQYLKGSNPQLNAFRMVPNDPSGQSLSASVARHKIYTRPDSLILSIDKTGDATHLLYLNLQHKTCTYQKIASLESACNKSNSKQDWNYSNSYLLGHYLFQINSCNVRTLYGVTDLNTNQLLQNFQFNSSDTIPYRNSPFILRQQGAYVLLDTLALDTVQVQTDPFAPPPPKLTRPLALSKNFIKRMGQHDAAIGARFTPQGQLELTIGGQSANEREATSYWEASANWMTFYLLNNNPGSSYNAVYYKSLLDPQTFAHLPGSTAPDAYELVLNARATTYKGAGIYGETVFYFNTAFYIGAYFKEKQQYQIFKYNK